MSMERREAQLNGMNVSPDCDVVHISRTATYTSDTLEVFEQIVRVDTETVDGTFSLALPSVALAKGKIYDITLADDHGDLTLTDNADDAGMTDIVFDTEGDYVVLLSNGYTWRALVGDVASGI